MPDFIKSNYFLPFLLGRFRGTSFFAVCKNIAGRLRRVFLIGRILRYIGIAVSVISASATLIAATAFFLLLIPLLALFATAAFLADRAVGSRIIKSRRLCEYLKRERIFVFAEAGGFGCGFAEAMATDGAAVFVVTQSPSRPFISAEFKNGVYYLRHPFYFRLKRRYLKHMQEKITYLL